MLTAASFQSKAAAEDDKPKAIVAASVEDAGEDFEFQGEYTGEVTDDDGKARLGVQVIALGDGRFDAVAYPGGLPGDGWDGAERIKAKGVLENGAVRLKSEEGAGVVKDGALSISDKNGNEIGTLKKVERKSSTLGKKPPKGAVVLFDGSTADHFNNGQITEDKLLMPGVTSKQKFGDCTVHLEFRLPFMPAAGGQARGNSGCYLQGRYEVQILDSFGLKGKNNESGGIYEISDPAVNMCYPPLVWQTYDVDFTAARYDVEGKKTANARMTVRHNGIVVQKDVEVPRSTRAAPVAEGPDDGPLYLQDHGNPVRFKNIWVVATSGDEQAGDDAKDGEAPDGFVSLFDGKSLDGWHKNPERIGHGTGGKWYVEDGAIVGEQDPPGSGNGGILLTDRKFEDFELLIDMKPDWGVCSGLFLRSTERGQCFQMMVDYHDNGNVGHVYGEGSGGFNTRAFDIFGKYDDEKNLTALTTRPVKAQPEIDYTIDGDEWVKAWKPGEWNTARVRVVGNPPEITTWINGKKVCVFDGRSYKSPQYDKKRVSELLGDEGRIAVQVHGGKGWPNGAKCRWKNIFVKVLR